MTAPQYNLYAPEISLCLFYALHEVFHRHFDHLLTEFDGGFIGALDEPGIAKGSQSLLRTAMRVPQSGNFARRIKIIPLHLI